MQDESKILYKAVAKVVHEQRVKNNRSYTEFCYENDIPMSTYDDIINAKTKASFYNISKLVKALGLNFEEFGKLLDENLPKNFMKEE